MLFIREEIPSKLLSECKPNSSTENIFIEINLSSQKRLLLCFCNRNLTLINHHIQNISRALDFYSSKYDNFIALRNHNVELSNSTVSESFSIYNLKDLIKDSICFKILEHLTYTDLILTKWSKSFQNANVFKAGLSNFHKLIFNVGIFLLKQKPKGTKFRNYKKFDISLSRNDLLNKVLSKNVQTSHLDSFKADAQYIFDRYASFKVENMLYVTRLHL